MREGGRGERETEREGGGGRDDSDSFQTPNFLSDINIKLPKCIFTNI